MTQDTQMLDNGAPLDVKSWSDRTPFDPRGAFNVTIPSGVSQTVDWDRWLGSAPKESFNAASRSRCCGGFDAIAGDRDGENSTGSETDAAADFRMRHEIAGKDRERVRTAHGNYSQRESEQAQRVWQAGQDPESGKPNRAHFEVYAERPADSTLLLSSTQVH